MLLEVVYSVTDPPIKALRRVIPPLRLGNFALDLSFILVMVAAYLLLAVVLGGVLGVRPGGDGCPPAGAIVRRADLNRYRRLEWVRSCR